MDFDKIKYFLTLAETLNYTQASNRLFISQSMLSRHIKSIESEIGAKLFTRTTHGVALTAAGEIYAKGLKTINNDYGFILSQTQMADVGRHGAISIAIINCYTLGNVASVIRKYLQVNPGLEISLHTVFSPEQLYRELVECKSDLGMAMKLGSIYPDLSTFQLCKSGTRLVTSRHSEILKASGGAPIELSSLRGATFVTPVDGISTAYRNLHARCAKAGFLPKILPVPDITTAILNVELDRGVLFMHQHSAFLGNSNLAFSPMSEEDNTGGFFVYWNPKVVTPQKSTFLEYLQNAKYPSVDFPEEW